MANQTLLRKPMKKNCCNRCGRELEATEDAFVADKVWGYFSKKDLAHHHFILCESCYDNLLASFCIPVTEDEVAEVL